MGLDLHYTLIRGITCHVHFDVLGLAIKCRQETMATELVWLSGEGLPERQLPRPRL